MVRLSTALVFLATLAMGFTSPLEKRDDVKVLDDMAGITDQYRDLLNLVVAFSPNSTVDDAYCVHNMMVSIANSFDQAGNDAAEAGPFTPTSSGQAVQSLFRMEADVLASTYVLIIIKQYLEALGYLEQIHKDIIQMHAKSTLCANTIRTNLPDYIQGVWQSVEKPIQDIFNQASIAYSYT